MVFLNELGNFKQKEEIYAFDFYDWQNVRFKLSKVISNYSISISMPPAGLAEFFS